MLPLIIEADLTPPTPSNPQTPGTGTVIPPRYAVIDLGTSNYPVALNNPGSVVLASWPPPGNTEIYQYWTNGAVAGGNIPLTKVCGMNDNGMVVGTISMTTSYYGIVTLDSQTYQQNFQGYSAYTWSIPTGRQLVGASPPSYLVGPVSFGGGYDQHSQIILPQGTISTTSPNLPPGVNGGSFGGYPVGIANSGNVYGNNYQTYTPQCVQSFPLGSLVSSYMAVLNNGRPPSGYPNGTLVEIGNYPDGWYPLANNTAGYISALFAVNNQGVAVGEQQAINSIENYTPINNSLTNTMYGTYDGTNFHAIQGYPRYIANNNDILGTNAAGAVLLFTNASPTGTALPKGILGPMNTNDVIVNGSQIYQTNVVSNLNTLVQTNAGWGNISAATINDPGAIVGTATADGSNPAFSAGSHGVMLIPGELAVDANGDGTIVMANDTGNPANAGLPVDTTSQAKPFQFWINDDQDDGPGPSSYGNDEVPPATLDSSSTTITSVRDLEDWTRLWIYTKGLNTAIQAGTIKVGLKWKNISRGTPAIRLEKAEDVNGGLGYLGTLASASAQAAEPTSGMGSNNRLVTPTGNAADYVFDPVAFTSLSDTAPKTCFLFSGVSGGTGELVLVFLKSDGTTEIGEGGQLWLDLRDIKEMYIRELAQPQPAYPYATTSGQPDADIIGESDTLGGSFVPNPNENTSNPTYVVFVHGFNMDYAHSTNYAETFFKRLWQLGYRGRFASFRWPTYGTGGNLGAVGTYNDSEYVAWNSGSALKSFVQGLSGYHIDVVAHSMGNMVVGEALREGMAVDHVAMLHAASSASCYDDAFTSYPATNSYTTPDTSSDPPTRSLGYSGYLGGVIGGLVNFDDPGDSTIVYWWNANNSNFKPQYLVASGNYYSYTPGNASGNKLQFTVSLGSSRPVATFSEAAAYVDQSLTGSIGSNTGVAGSITANVSEAAMGDSHSYEWDNPICDPTTLSLYTSVMGRSVFNLSPLTLTGP